MHLKGKSRSSGRTSAACLWQWLAGGTTFWNRDFYVQPTFVHWSFAQMPPWISAVCCCCYVALILFFLLRPIGAAQIKLIQKHAADDEGGELPERQVLELPVSLFPEPRCSYQVRLHSEQGPPVNRQVSIGETLWHIWGCAYEQHQSHGTTVEEAAGPISSVYCMMVHNCTISNQRVASSNSLPVEIVDEFGCSAWPGLLPQISYQGDLRATMAVQTFALDFDQPAIFFKCHVRLLLKINGRCRRPQCAQWSDGDEAQFRRANAPLLNFP